MPLRARMWLRVNQPWLKSSRLGRHSNTFIDTLQVSCTVVGHSADSLEIMDKSKVVRRQKLLISPGTHFSFGFLHNTEYTQSYLRLSSDLLLQHLPEGLAVFRKLFDALMELVEGHLLLQ
jgi:hypothetical protein